MICKKCKRSLTALMCLALLEDAGCTVSPSAAQCSEGGEHEFTDKTAHYVLTGEKKGSEDE